MFKMGYIFVVIYMNANKHNTILMIALKYKYLNFNSKIISWYNLQVFFYH